ncbi:DUF488 domain-containing protein [Cellulomonas cellasea]|uniref:Uncharacterized protein (DUF488 family) n=1 Tax=Cellulomonas cellasea TaxID=43670 RepID=A0A7W4YDR7_9CELL|nr:DUF488 domain-containing protein [Cellulomonas cellasea]MBB2924851.1 uncharacterized protein (DUF488 family) [Cellulomonas cellasea]
MLGPPPPGAPSTGRPLLTFGHGIAGRDKILTVLLGADVGLLVDVRRFPGSRRNPHVARDELARWLPEAGIDYRWEPRLGGRRTVAAASSADAAGGRGAEAADGPHGPAGAVDDPGDPWWRVEAFRAYAAHTRTDEFRDGMAALLDDVARGPRATVVMCSETVWWRCHRRLVSDVAVLLHGVPVEHLGHDGRRTPHPPSEGARVTDAGLRYDAGGRDDDRPDDDPA